MKSNSLMKLSCDDNWRLSLFLLLMGFVTFVVFHGQIFPQRSLSEFVAASILFVLDVLVYIRIISKSPFSLRMCYSLMFSGLIAFAGGCVAFAAFPKIGNVLILLSGMINAGIWVYFLIVYVNKVIHIRADDNVVPLSQLFILIVMWLYPFWLNLIV